MGLSHHTDYIAPKTWNRVLVRPLVDDEVHHNADKAFSLRFREERQREWRHVQQTRNAWQREELRDKEQFGKQVQLKARERATRARLQREREREKAARVQLWHSDDGKWRERQRQRREKAEMQRQGLLGQKRAVDRLEVHSDRVIDALDVRLGEEETSRRLEEEMGDLFERYDEKKKRERFGE